MNLLALCVGFVGFGPLNVSGVKMDPSIFFFPMLVYEDKSIDPPDERNQNGRRHLLC